MIPDTFYKVIRDFVADLLSTFPELTEKGLDPSLSAVRDGAASDHECFGVIHQFVSSLGTKHMFDILSENPAMFEKECLLLPGVDFSVLWKENISDTTKTTIWKYLKLVLMSSVEHGDFMDEAMQEKLKKDVRDFFEEGATAPPTPESMNEHLKGLVSGKLGDLAKEIASETMGGTSEAQMADFMKDPSKLCNLVQNVGGKIDEKIKSGELKESELIEEASAMLSKIKDMPGFDQILRQFTGGAKVDFAGMQSKFNQNAKAAKTKERLKKKLADRKKKAVEN